MGVKPSILGLGRFLMGNIHEPQDMAHARKMKTISLDTIFMGKEFNFLDFKKL
jgi:hypothetical protein